MITPRPDIREEGCPNMFVRFMLLDIRLIGGELVAAFFEILRFLTVFFCRSIAFGESLVCAFVCFCFFVFLH